MIIRKNAFLSLLLVMVIPSPVVVAQGKVPGSSRILEEIIVTASRREESAQSVPVSVNAFSASILQDRTVTALGDLARIAPGIRFVHTGGGGNMNVVMRGLARIPVGSAPNAVISYFSDIPLNFQGSNLSTYDISNIQVLKGPQGTLFGRNAMAGAVLITPQAPSYEYGGYINGGVGNYDYNDLEGAINIPLVNDVAALRLAGKISRRDPYTKNMGAGNDTDNIDKNSFRASLLLEPGYHLRNTTVVDYQESDEAGSSILSRVLPNGLVRDPALATFWNCSAASVPCMGFNPDRDIDDALMQQKRWGPHKMSSEINQKVETKLFGVSNRTEWDIGTVTLRNILGYRTTEVLTDVNADGVSFVPNIMTASDRVRTKQLSDEVHLFGKIFDERLDYLVGAFWIKEEPDGRNGALYAVATPVVPWVHAYTDQTNKALFAQLGYQIAEKFKIHGGYRYNKTKQEVCALSVGSTNIHMNPEPLVSEGQCRDLGSITKANENAKTWNIGLDWQVSDNVFAYITRRKGYREGGINAPAFSTSASAVLQPYQTYDPETLKDIEVGLKTEFFVDEMAIRLNISAFRGKHDNVVTSFSTAGLVPATDPGAPQSNSIGINTGKRTLSGFESEVVLEPFSGLTLSNSTSYVHQKINELTLPHLQGLEIPSLEPASPKWSNTFAVRWVMPVSVAGGELVLNADYYWQDHYFSNHAEMPSYEVASMRLDWLRIGGTGVDLGFFVRNILDDEYPYAAVANVDSLGFFTFAYAEPRMYGMELKYSF